MNMYDFYLLHAQSDRVLRSKVSAILESSNITMMEWLLLGVINEGPAKGSTMSDIAQSLHVTLPQVTALVNKLLPLKLIKQKSASSDRRSRLVSMTSKGEVVFADCEKLLKDETVNIFGTLDEDVLKTYTDLLQRVSSST